MRTSRPSTNTAENSTDAPNADLANAAAGGAHLANVAGTNPSTNTTVGANAEHVAEDTPVRDVAVTTSAESDVVATVQNEGTPRPGASVPATVVTVPQGATAAIGGMPSSDDSSAPLRRLEQDVPVPSQDGGAVPDEEPEIQDALILTPPGES